MAAGAGLVAAATLAAQSQSGPSVADYASIQEAIDRNPGRMVFVPAGDHPVSETIRLRSDHSGLWGPGRIVAENPEAMLVEISGVNDVQLRDLTFTRAAGRMETHRAGIFVVDSTDVVLSNVQVLDNRGDLASIYIRTCTGVRIRDCLIQNYSRISVDDRRRSPGHPDFEVVGGYAFNTISGTGLGVRASQGVLIQNNRVIERVMIPTPELKAKFKLGSFQAKDATKGSGLPQAMWEAAYNNAWHQGSAIALANVMTDPLVGTNPFVAKEPAPVPRAGTDHCYQVIGNYIENAAQGMDIHVDHAIVAGNIVHNSFMGMKAMHGARNVIILGNQVSRNDLWGIMLAPGTASHAAMAATAAGRPAEEANIDGYTIVANNIISDFGYGHARWIWQNSDPTPLFFNGDRFKPDTPPLRNVIVQGNVVYDTGRDQILADDRPRLEAPRYRHAVKIVVGTGAPQNLNFSGNLLNPGTEGIANIPLTGDKTAPANR
jgi:hypothetical protein